MKLFLDTNILIDKLSNRKPYIDDVRKLCIAKYYGDVELLVSVQSYLDAFFVLRKYASQDVLRQKCIDTFNFFDVVDVDKINLVYGLKSDWHEVEDFMIAKSAQDNKADYLITRDLEGFEKSEIKTLTPKDFIELLDKDFGVKYEQV